MPRWLGLEAIEAAIADLEWLVSLGMTFDNAMEILTREIGDTDEVSG